MCKQCDKGEEKRLDENVKQCTGCGASRVTEERAKILTEQEGEKKQ